MGYIIRRLLLLFSPGFFQDLKKNNVGGGGGRERPDLKFSVGIFKSIKVAFFKNVEKKAGPSPLPRPGSAAGISRQQVDYRPLFTQCGFNVGPVS